MNIIFIVLQLPTAVQGYYIIYMHTKNLALHFKDTMRRARR